MATYGFALSGRALWQIKSTSKGDEMEDHLDLWDGLKKENREGREVRVEALRLAFDLLKGTELATDYQSIVRAARTFQGYIEEG